MVAPHWAAKGIPCAFNLQKAGAREQNASKTRETCEKHASDTRETCEYFRRPITQLRHPPPLLLLRYRTQDSFDRWRKRHARMGMDILALQEMSKDERGKFE